MTGILPKPKLILCKSCTFKGGKSPPNIDSSDIHCNHEICGGWTTFKTECPGYIEKKSISPVEIGNQILESVSIVSIRGNLDEMYFYENGAYKPHARDKIRELSDKLLYDKSRKRIIEDIIHHIQNITQIDREELNSNKNYINLKNGLYNLKTKSLEPHNPKILSTIQIPVNYDINAECPEISTFLCEILKPEDILLILQIFGYCLIPDYFIQKAVMLNGEGLNGKGTLGRLLCAFIGNENKSSESLKALNTDKFSSANLYGKLVNIDTDLSDSAIYDDTTFKKLTGGDSISAQRKFQNAFNFTNFARMFFGCNNIPRHPKGGFAWMRRWLLIDFPVQFKANEDKNLDARLQTPRELSGLLNLAIKALHLLLETKTFYYNKSPEQVGEEYLLKSDSVIAFMDEMTVPSDGYIHSTELYRAYVEWAKSKGLRKIERDNRFGKSLKNAGYVKSKYRIDDKDIRGYDDIEFKEPADNLPTTCRQENQEAYTHWFIKSDNLRQVRQVKFQINLEEKSFYILYKGEMIDIYLTGEEPAALADKQTKNIENTPIDIDYYGAAGCAAGSNQKNNSETDLQKCGICGNPLNGNSMDSGLPGMGRIHKACGYELMQVKVIADTPAIHCVDGSSRPVKAGTLWNYPRLDALRLIHETKAETIT